MGLQGLGQALASVELAVPGDPSGRPAPHTCRAPYPEYSMNGASIWKCVIWPPCMGPRGPQVPSLWTAGMELGAGWAQLVTKATSGGMRATPCLPYKQTSCCGLSLPGICALPSQLLPAQIIPGAPHIWLTSPELGETGRGRGVLGGEQGRGRGGELHVQGCYPPFSECCQSFFHFPRP